MVHSFILRNKLIMESLYMRAYQEILMFIFLFLLEIPEFFVWDFGILFLCSTGRPKSCCRPFSSTNLAKSEQIYWLLKFFYKQINKTLAKVMKQNGIAMSIWHKTTKLCDPVCAKRQRLSFGTYSYLVVRLCIIQGLCFM